MRFKHLTSVAAKKRDLGWKCFSTKGNHWSQHQGFSFPQIWGQSPMAWASKWGKQSCALLEWNLVSTRAHHQQGEVPVWACNDLHETITCLPLYSTFRRVADPYWIANGFLFLPVFCWHTVLVRVHRGQVCLLRSLMPSWNGKLVEMSKWSGLRSWCGYCYRVEHALKKSLPKTSPVSARGFRGTEDFEFVGSCLVVVGFCALFIYF